MKNSSNNSFIKLTEATAGRVGIKLQLNQFNKNEGTPNYYGKVERFTLSVQNTLEGIANELPQIDTGTVASVLNSYTNVVLKALESGNAVKFGELGMFYIASKGVVDSETGRPELTVKFTASQTLKNVVKNIEIASSEFKKAEGKIFSVTNVATGLFDGTVTTGGSCLLEGIGIKVSGENSGIYFAPVTETGAVSTDENSWIKVISPLVYNTPSKLLFTVPDSVVADNSYKIVIRTHCAGRSGYERKELIETISDTVTVTA
ncbi:HU family DNA-binding protein [Treponema peruense]|uniref:DUF4469 domain-containing protein n=1 Tax=Treponema peruense TaxID=2787628 RepID=A0A7T3V571_9SPIR|nr:DUF4469 domain-containing protein [Treponema peruense]QQA00849.1 DUF4469 domain-containing protein [Treponema peruense]